MKNDYKIDRHKFFDTEERKAILKATEDRALADMNKGRLTWQVRWMLVHLAMYSGLRVSEISRLKIQDLHLGNGMPYIHVQKGKRGKDRDVYIDRNLVNHLKEFIKKKKHFDHPDNPDAPLFVTKHQGQFKPFSTTSLTLSFRKAVENAGLRSDLTIHSARHTYAVMYYHKTKDLREVKNQLGHAD